MIKAKNIDSGKVFYSDLIPELEHFFTTRNSALNTDKNKVLTAKYLDIQTKDLIFPTQTHSSNIAIAEIGKNNYPDTDALILTNKQQAIYLRFADCTPIILYDKKNNIGAIAHAGWRGTVAQISQKTVKKMAELTNSTDFSNIYAVIGASIGFCCYNVGDEVIRGINNSVKNNIGLFRETEDKIFVDLKKVNQRQLEEVGIPKENIDVCEYCTSCNNDLFYSYRKENGTTLRHNAVIKLK